MIHKVLITGASGLVGKAITNALIAKGYQVNTLNRKPQKSSNAFYWNVYKQEIDHKCLDGVDAIIHLAGEAVVDKKWTLERKKQIIDSRTLSTQLLFNAIKEIKNHNIKAFVAASAVGFYGDCGDEILTEETEKGYGFLPDCCKLWEDSVDQIKKLSIRVIKLRTGIVLSKKGGALPAMDKTVKLFIGSALGTGKQWTPWLHINDMVNLYIYALENPGMSGAFNACAPFPVTNKNLMKAIANHLKRPLWPINVPKKAIKLLMGERVEAILMSSNTSAQKVLNTGFKFEFTDINNALADLYSH